VTRRRGPLDILYVGMLPPVPGGSAIVAGQLLSRLAKLGHSVRALAPITGEARLAGDRFAAVHPEIEITRFEVPYFDVSPGVGASEAYVERERDGIGKRFRGLVDERRPDLVVIGKKRLMGYVPELARACALPSIMLFHSSTTAETMGGADRGRVERLRAAYHEVDLMIAVAEHLTTDLQQLGTSHARAIPNGVDLEAFSPRPKDADLLRCLNLRHDQVIVLHASNLKPVKRPLDVVDSAEHVLRRNPEAVYVVVGNGPDRRAIEARCRGKGILERFRFVGWVEHERIPDYLNLADIVVMPSDSEGLALVYLETQACGRLLLASDIPAAREVVRDGETGLLFRVRDVDELAAKTLRAAADPGLRAAIGRRARESVRAYDLGCTVAAYEHAFLEVAGRPRH
jgi:glycosyltransferase involved in cell wall biosynthesis